MKLDRIKRNFQQPLKKQYAYPNVVVNLTTEPPPFKEKIFILTNVHS